MGCVCVCGGGGGGRETENALAQKMRGGGGGGGGSTGGFGLVLTQAPEVQNTRGREKFYLFKLGVQLFTLS